MFLFILLFGVHTHQVPCANPDFVRDCGPHGCTECQPVV